MNRILSSLIKYFSPHNYVSFKVGRFPLVAAYSSKDCVVKYGNSVYFDGTIYQRKYIGTNAINFVEKYISELNSRDVSMKIFEEQIGVNLFDNDNEIRLRRETIGGYEKIIKIIFHIYFMVYENF